MPTFTAPVSRSNRHVSGICNQRQSVVRRVDQQTTELKTYVPAGNDSLLNREHRRLNHDGSVRRVGEEADGCVSIPTAPCPADLTNRHS